jgi:hypothetical protein
MIAFAAVAFLFTGQPTLLRLSEVGVGAGQ